MFLWKFQLLLFYLTTIVSGKNDFLSENGVQLNKQMNTIREIQPDNLINYLIDNKINIEKLVNNKKCNNQLKYYLNDIRKFELWALKMLDSSSKTPTGILIGNLNDLGMWDECLSVKINKNNDFIEARHCMYTVSIKEQVNKLPLPVTLSICLPASCTENMVSKLLQYPIDMVPSDNDTKPSLIYVKCSSIKSEPWQIGGIIVNVLLFTFLIFIFICTICDIYYRSIISKTNEHTIIKNMLKFSIYKNAEKLFSTKIPPGTLSSIEGIRFLSMTWVVYGHESFHQIVSSKTINFFDYKTWNHSWNGILTSCSPFNVDTFFAISGLLTSYLFMKGIWKGKKFNLIMYYIHRYWRLTPSLGIVLLFMIFFIRRMGSGPIWENNMELQEGTCANIWWSYFLYIQNYCGIATMGCLGHTWYLAVDMHFFLMSPLILYPLSKRPKIGMTILAGFIIASIILPIILTVKNKYSQGIYSLADNAAYIDMMMNFYMNSYNRAGPWLLGAYTGYKIAGKNNEPLAKSIKWFGWIMTIISFLFCITSYRIYQDYDYKYNYWWEGFYAGFAKHIWAFGICWTIYASTYDINSILNKILSLPIFLPFGRISYGVYLIHYVYEFMRMSGIKTATYFSDALMIQWFISDYVVVIFIAILFNIIFEAPFVTVEKIIFGSRKNNKINITTTPSTVEIQNNNGAVQRNKFLNNNKNYSNVLIRKKNKN